MREIIKSRENLRVKRLAGLLSRGKERDEAGLFAAEGLRLCLDALDSNIEIRSLYLTEEAFERYPQVSRLLDAAEQIYWLDANLAGRIADTKSCQGIFVIADQLDNRQSAVTIKSDGYYLLLNGIRDPGNLGAILRTADALGVDGVLISDCCDLYAPKVLRGSMGGLFRLAVARWPDLTGAVKALRESGAPVYAAALTDDAMEAGGIDFSGGGAVLIGNEGNGLPEGLIQACSAAVMIPMAAGSNSLNAAVAAAILLWEMKRHRLGGTEVGKQG